MIFTFFVNGALLLIGSALAAFGVVAALPLGQDSIFVTYVGYVFAFSSVFWPVQPVLACMLVYIPLKIAMIGVKFVLGARTPAVYAD